MNFLIALKSLSWIGLIVLFIFISFTAMKAKDENRCEQIRVIFKNDKNLGFIHSKEIIREVNDANPSWTGQKSSLVKANLIEHAINENDYVKRAEIYIDQNRKMNVFVEPKAPLARIHQSDYSYYLSEDWDKMPLSQNFSKRVMHVSGRVGRLMNSQDCMDSFVEKELKIFLNYTEKNEIWKTMIDQIIITPQGKFELYLTFSDAAIKIGYINANFEKRMEKIIHFFKTAPYHSNLSQYSALDFQFSQQVIASR